MIRARVPLAVSLYTVGLFVYLVMAQEAAKPRFCWCLFGIFIGAAAKLPRWLFWSVAIASAGLLAFCVRLVAAPLYRPRPLILRISAGKNGARRPSGP